VARAAFAFNTFSRQSLPILITAAIRSSSVNPTSRPDIMLLRARRPFASLDVFSNIRTRNLYRVFSFCNGSFAKFSMSCFNDASMDAMNDSNKKFAKKYCTLVV